MRNLAVIPARSGSKGLKDKNIKSLNGKPLMSYPIEAAFSSGVFDTVHVSTDSSKYAEIAVKYGANVPFLRSLEESSDLAYIWDAIVEVLIKYEELGERFDTVALLQPTSPLSSAEDIRKAYRIMEKKQADAVVSVCEAAYPPLWCNTLPEDGCMNGFSRPETEVPRQELECYYQTNGAIYVVTVSALLKDGGLALYGPNSYAYIMPRERSVDIDGAFDFLIAEALLESGDKLSGNC